MSKARLTYRLDGSDKGPSLKREVQPPEPRKIVPLHDDEFHVLETAPEQNHYTHDYGAWHSPFDAETRRIEELIRRSNERNRRDADESVPERKQERSGYGVVYRREEEPKTDYDPVSGYYDTVRELDLERIRGRAPDYRSDGGGDRREAHGQQEQDDTWRDVPVVGSRTVRYTKTPWLKVSLSVTGAVLTGALLGFFVLRLFSGEGLPDFGQKAAEPAAGGAAPQQKAAAPAVPPQSNPAAAAAAAVQQGAAAAADVSLPARSYTLLQTGGFGTAQAAAAAAADLQTKGVTAVIEQADNYFVYVGLAQSRYSAKQLAAHLQDKKIDIYVKTVTLPAAAKIRWNGKTDTLQNYLSRGNQLVQMISGLTVVHLDEAKPTPLGESSMQSLKSAHDAWTAAAAGLGDGAPQEARPALQKMTNAVNTAKSSLDEYKKTPSSAMLWQAQTNLMQYVIAEKELLASIAVK